MVAPANPPDSRATIAHRRALPLIPTALKGGRLIGAPVSGSAFSSTHPNGVLYPRSRPFLDRPPILGESPFLLVQQTNAMWIAG